jgi:hypothetical protein
MHAGYISVTEKVQKILLNGKTKAIQKASWAMKLFSGKTDTDSNCDECKKRDQFESINKEDADEVTLTQSITELNKVTRFNFKNGSAESTPLKNVIFNNVNAKKVTLSNLNNHSDDEKNDKQQTNPTANNIVVINNKEHTTGTSLNANPAIHLDEISPNSIKQQSNKFLTKDSNSKATSQTIEYKYGSVNYYAVLDYEFTGNYWDHNKYINEQRKQQIPNPPDISNSKKKYTSYKKSFTQSYTKTKKKTVPDTNIHRKTVTAQFFQRLSVLDYTTRVTQGLIYTSMTSLKKSETILPVVEIPTNTQKSQTTTTDPATQTIVDDWTTVGAKGCEHKFEEIFALSSTKYLPKNLPPGPVNSDIMEQNTIHTFPLMVKISKPPRNKQQLHHTRIVVAVFAAMQKICKETYLAPRAGTGNLTNYTSPLQVSMHPVELKLYMELPSEENQNKNLIVACLIVKSNNDLNEFKANQKFVEYLAREHIVLDVNGLIDVSPEHVGYLEQVAGRHETIASHTARIKELLPTDFPQFQLNVQSIKITEGRAKVFMINCDKVNLNMVREAMCRLHREQKIRFMSWREFSGMDELLRKVAVRKEILYNKEYDSLLIDGFCDNQDNITMHMPESDDLDISNDDDENTDPMANMFVSDFIAQIKSGRGTVLFTHVYPPHQGVREVLVKHQDKSEAKEFIKVLRGEISKNMNDTAMKLVFSDYEAAIQERTNSNWQPYTRAAELLAECQANNSLLNPAKRSRKSDQETSTKNVNSKNKQTNEKPRNTNNTSGSNTVKTNTSPIINAWSTPLLGNTTPPVTVVNQAITPTTTMTTMSNSAEDMDDFKASIREEIAASQLQVEEMKKEIEQARITTNNSINNLDRKIQSSSNNMEYKINELSQNTDASIAKLNASITKQNIEVQKQIFENQDSMNIGFSDIKSMLSEIMLGKSTGLSKRIKTLTTTKHRNINPNIVKCTTNEEGTDMSFDDIINNSTEAIDFDSEKNFTQSESEEPAILK